MQYTRQRPLPIAKHQSQPRPGAGRDTIYHIVKSYLESRWQFLASDSSMSSKRRIYTGVPQGSILGLRLFRSYINDLHQVIKDSRIALFADDTTVLNAVDKTSLLITQDLKNVTN